MQITQQHIDLLIPRIRDLAHLIKKANPDLVLGHILQKCATAIFGCKWESIKAKCLRGDLRLQCDSISVLMEYSGLPRPQIEPKIVNLAAIILGTEITVEPRNTSYSLLRTPTSQTDHKVSKHGESTRTITDVLESAAMKFANTPKFDENGEHIHQAIPAKPLKVIRKRKFTLDK